jgi:hypothetical protein
MSTGDLDEQETGKDLHHKKAPHQTAISDSSIHEPVLEKKEIRP